MTNNKLLYTVLLLYSSLCSINASVVIKCKLKSSDGSQTTIAIHSSQPIDDYKELKFFYFRQYTPIIKEERNDSRLKNTLGTWIPFDSPCPMHELTGLHQYALNRLEEEFKQGFLFLIKDNKLQGMAVKKNQHFSSKGLSISKEEKVWLYMVCPFEKKKENITSFAWCKILIKHYWERTNPTTSIDELVELIRVYLDIGFTSSHLEKSQQKNTLSVMALHKEEIDQFLLRNNKEDETELIKKQLLVNFLYIKIYRTLVSSKKKLIFNYEVLTNKQPKGDKSIYIQTFTVNKNPLYCPSHLKHLCVNRNPKITNTTVFYQNLTDE